ncbi:hypothetical protein OUZ56_028100 [Daphnia magna]|uniref:Uncharacterized protein n=1 Tax=Daphnia magna TaxID=35525 RepID=A0ABR0B2V9_9CRUS|nr:hypothetical protein OUZ56_028100 [Daphnia magna]
MSPQNQFQTSNPEFGHWIPKNRRQSSLEKNPLSLSLAVLLVYVSRKEPGTQRKRGTSFPSYTHIHPICLCAV